MLPHLDYEVSFTHAATCQQYAPLPCVSSLTPGPDTDSVPYLGSDPAPVQINKSFAVVPEALTDLQVRESLQSEAQMILLVKRRDFLGDARWEFRHCRLPIEAKIFG